MTGRRDDDSEHHERRMEKAKKTRRMHEEDCMIVYKYKCMYRHRYRLKAAVICVQLCSVKY
jgi:hypothetical protein